jgi:hypothetical protein
VETGVTYTLKVDLGWRNDDASFGSTAALLVNGVDYFATGTPVKGGWATFTATYTGKASDAGDHITIELLSLHPQANFDNVLLSDNLTAVPEPGFAGLLGLGVSSLLVSARLKRARRKKAA